ncbi:hypothetical protein [Streptomyces sp. SID13726]|uniref:hypothetical protein n=1 Tax=Streptomyces sp. SID13726 TaxID=2706058 RepID=UPI0013B7B653|nr:hypothetical protein [Streptomyces sp. SID13726]NEB03401.1 hypothetical protein [Streptomyces sp. SID13726]
MSLSQRRRAALQQRMRESGFGGGHRVYAITGVLGSLGQMAWRTIAVLNVLALCMLCVTRPPSALLKITFLAGLLLVWIGLRLAWRRLSAALDLNRCLLYADGLILTDQFGQWQGTAAWADVTHMKHTYGAWLFTVSHRFELTRRAAPPITFNVLGPGPDLVKELQARAARHEIPQQNVHIRVR